MYTQGKKYLLDAHMRLTADRIPVHVSEMNQGKISPNIYYGKEIVGELIFCRNLSNKIVAEVLWYEDSAVKFQFEPKNCHVGLFNILSEYDDKKANV